MPQQKQLLWSKLKVGLLTLTSLIILTIGIFLISGQVGFFTKTVTIRTLAPDAAGLKTGAPVRFTGIDVGTVRKVQISGLTESSQAVEIVMDVVREYQPQIHTDSEAFLVAEGLLGERYINISKGTPGSPTVAPGATVPFHATAEFSELVGGSRDLLDNMNVLTSRVNGVVGKIESGEGTIGKLIQDETLYNRLDSTVNTAQRFVSDLSSGKGSIGRLMQSDDLYQHIDSAVTRLQSVADELQNGDGTVPRMIRDPALYQKADQLLARGNVLIDNVNQGKGTLGKLAQDEELYRRINSAAGNADSVLAGLQKGEGSFGRLLHDPALYESLNNTSLEVRGLLADFRHNPKKFLTIQLRIF
jgi:phospholipid/cholesterol/gamma-HCH transport system substrate-binding protein